MIFAVISGTIVGILLLISFFIIIIIIVLLCRRRKKSKKAHNIDDKYEPSSNPHQHTYNTSDQSQHDDTDNNASSQLGIDPTSRLETVNELYIPTEVKSLEQHGHDRSGSCDVIITSNSSYIVSPNSLQTKKESEYPYNYVQTDDKLVQPYKVLEPATSGGPYNKITDLDDNVNIDSNPSNSPLQDVKPSYHILQVQL